MSSLFAALPLIFAQNAPAPGAGGPAPSPFATLLPLLPIFFLMYFILLRPKQIETKKLRAMIDAVKKNDKVLTAGGILGTVVSVDNENNRVVLRVDDGVKLSFSKDYIVKVLDTSVEKVPETA